MKIEDKNILKLADLDKLRSAPMLNKKQSKKLLNELEHIIFQADWLTIGVMSPTLEIGIKAIRSIEEIFKFKQMQFKTLPDSDGPVFLKANQKTGEIHARIEYGLGEGVLISCHSFDNSIIARTIGPLPLDFFNDKF